MSRLLEGKTVVCDIETDSLDATKIWCIVCQEVDPDTGKELNDSEPKVFRNTDLDSFVSYSSDVTTWIGHNFIGFDGPVLNRLIRTRINPRSIIDTFVVSKWLNFQKKGGHSLENWANRFPDVNKVAIAQFDNEDDIEKYVQRCIEDVKINTKVFQYIFRFLNDPQYYPSIRVELDIEIINKKMQEDGFYFNLPKAQEILQEVSSRLEALNAEIAEAFPSFFKPVKEIHPKATKAGELNKQDFRWEDETNLSQYSPGCPFTRIEEVAFNPASAKQRVDALNKAGWRPVERTDGYIKAKREGRLTKELEEYGWKCNEENLSTLPEGAPYGAKVLAQWMVLEGKRRELTQWINNCSKRDQRIHGTVWGIGTWTHRMAHTSPNTGNIASATRTEGATTAVEEIKAQYNGVLRSLWEASPSCYLVGTDAEGIQLRVLAHYIADVDPDYAHAIENGVKEDKTDIHNVNMQKLGDACKTRDDAKTFIYAWILGAAPPKIASILDVSIDEAKDAMNLFLQSTPGLKYLKEEVIPADVTKGYFVGLDGRPVLCDSAHKMLAGYLQNGEAVVMKHANVKWRTDLKSEGIWFRQVNTVHDEWQTETRRVLEEAEYVGQVQSASIQWTGRELGVKCRLDGNYTVGNNWGESH